MLSRLVFILSLSAVAAKAPLKVPRTVLKLRGGVTLPEAGATIMVASGAMAYISPKMNFDNYGFKDMDDTALATMRGLGPWQALVGALLVSDTKKVHALSSFAAASSILMSIPSFETLGGPKMPSVIWIGLLAAIGKLGLEDKVSPWVNVALFAVNGAQFYFAPESTLKMYKITKPISKLGLAMTKLQGGIMLFAAAYLGALAHGFTQLQAFATAFVWNSISAATFAFKDAKPLGAPLAGPLFWAALSVVLAGMALK